MPRSNLSIEGAHIFWKNFSGKPSQYNAEGSRNFCVELTPELADALAADGWNIKHTVPKEDGDISVPYMQVSVAYGNYPPKIYKVTSKNKTLLDEDLVGDLDRDEISNVDLIISPYHWTIGTKSGIKAYCKTMYVTIVEDDFAKKYAYLDDEEELPFEEFER